MKNLTRCLIQIFKENVLVFVINMKAEIVEGFQESEIRKVRRKVCLEG